MSLTKRLSRRDFLRGVTMSSVGLALAACVPAAPTSDAVEPGDAARPSGLRLTSGPVGRNKRPPISRRFSKGTISRRIR